VNTGPAGYGGDGVEPGTLGGYGGKFPNGGGGGLDGGPGGGGGGSYLASLFKDQVLKAGGANRGDGSISITSLTPAVPEASTWAMMLAGFAGLGWLAHMRRRKTSPA
jgi:PEP-CTERM motif-containing protein